MGIHTGGRTLCTCTKHVLFSLTLCLIWVIATAAKHKYFSINWHQNHLPSGQVLHCTWTKSRGWSQISCNIMIKKTKQTDLELKFLPTQYILKIAWWCTHELLKFCFPLRTKFSFPGIKCSFGHGLNKPT